jgi:hypothetical protein
LKTASCAIGWNCAPGATVRLPSGSPLGVMVIVGGSGSVAGSGDVASPRSGKFRCPLASFSQSLKIARNAGRRTQLSQGG